MGHLITHTIQLQKIQIYESKYYISVGYQLPYMKLTSLPIQVKITDCIRSPNGHNLIINDTDSLKRLQQIDTYLSSHITNYKPILSKDERYHYLYFKQNPFIDAYVEKLAQLNQNQSDIILNVIKLKKNASSTYPIVYIL
tara:strand:+ start:1374 stop:1793 length:420 start_codon:yes stop_codon:yes gene_type:complete